MAETIHTTTAGRTGLLGADWQQALRAPLVLGLAALLVVQIGLAVLLGQGGGMAPTVSSAPLLDVDIDAVDRIEIASGDGGKVTLRRAGDGWVLPDLGDFPVSTTRVDQMLESLDGLSRPLPVATSVEAQRRFKVADDGFERRLTLGAGGGEARLIVGDSPGFRRLFARVDGEDAVYDLRLALFDLSAQPDDWIDRGLLQFDRGEIERIGVADGADGAEPWALVRAENGWALEGSDADIDQDEAESLVNAVATVSYNAVLAEDGDAQFDLDAPARVLTIQHDGKERRYLIAPIADSEDYALHQDGGPYTYRIGAFDAEMLLEPSRDGLLGGSEALGEADADNPDPAMAEPVAAAPDTPGESDTAQGDSTAVE